MVIKNVTVCSKNLCRQAAMMINSSDEKYRRNKLIFNGAGLVAGITAVSIMARQLAGTGDYDIALMLPFLAVCGVCLYMGMYRLDRNKYNQIREEYAGKGIERIEFEIDSEDILIRSGKTECICPWSKIAKWMEDNENFYLVIDEKQGEEQTPEIGALIAGNCIIISKKGFTQCNSRDLKQLCKAIMQAR